MNREQMRHHLARLEMMMAEERGINLSYEEAYNEILKASGEVLGLARERSYLHGVRND